MCENSDSYDGEILEEIAKQDNKHEFVGLINRLSSDDKESIIMEICYYDAANCLAAILDGEGGESLITQYLSDYAKNMPLHDAARGVAPRIASLLLEKGFSPDFRSDFDSPYICLKNALPLNVSLDYSRFRLWKSDRWKSPIHQIIQLCSWKKHPKTIRVIARNTKEIKHEFSKYLKQGKVFEVGALLAFASDLIMSSPSTIDRENGSISFKNIKEMRQFLLPEISRSLNGASSNTQLSEIKKTLRLLEIFDRVGDKLLEHMPMWDNYTSDSGNRVASLIEDAAYDEEAEIEYDHDSVPRAYYNPLPFHTSPVPFVYSIVKNTCVYSVMKSTTSEKIYFPSWSDEGSSHVDPPLPLPTQGLMSASLAAVKDVMTKHVLSNKLASFTGAFAKAVRHL